MERGGGTLRAGFHTLYPVLKGSLVGNKEKQYLLKEGGGGIHSRSGGRLCYSAEYLLAR